MEDTTTLPADSLIASAITPEAVAANEAYRVQWQRIQDWSSDYSERYVRIFKAYQELLPKTGAGSKSQKTKDKNEQQRQTADSTFRPLADLLKEEREQIDEARNWLKENAVGVTPSPEGRYRLESSCDASFATQTQSSHYAKHWLTPFENWLTAAGFEAVVSRHATEPVWELWANCPLWQWSALKQRIPLNFSLDVWKRENANVRVYLPTLPFDRLFETRM